jgi:hypothetical protein
MIKKLDDWHKTKVGYLLFAIVELALAYAFISLAIDRGNLWWYILTLIFLVGGLKNAFKFIQLLMVKPRRHR